MINKSMTNIINKVDRILNLKLNVSIQANPKEKTLIIQRLNQRLWISKTNHLKTMTDELTTFIIQDKFNNPIRTIKIVNI